MVIGIGTDIIEIDRIAELVDKENFCRKYFSDRENEYFESKKNKYEKIAGNYAAKEAFSKALGTGISGFALKDVEVLRDKCGKPYIELENSLKEQLEGYKIFVSISHCRDYATAVAVIEKES